MKEQSPEDRRVEAIGSLRDWRTEPWGWQRGGLQEGKIEIRGILGSGRAEASGGSGKAWGKEEFDI